MSIITARRKRSALYVSIAGLMLMVGVISLISARDPDGVSLRIGMIMVVIGASMWVSWQALLPLTLAVWLAPNIARSSVADYELFSLNMILEAFGLIGLAAFSTLARLSLRELEEEDMMLGLHRDAMLGIDPNTGIYEEAQLRISIEAELARSRRFSRTFALVLIGIDELRQRFDYRDENAWQQSFEATARLLLGTRFNVDRVYRYGATGFAMVLPESGPKDVNGLVRRLRRESRRARPAEGELGGPLPAYFGATFFPTCATSTDDLLRRAGIALRIASNNANHVQLDGAEAPEMPPVETLRQAPLEPVATIMTPELRILPPPPHLLDPDFHEADEEPPIEIYALQAPEPAVDEYAHSWQNEAPLSVVPRPRTQPPHLVAVPAAGEPVAEAAPLDSVNETLKRLDETLEMIRQLKKRSA